MTPIGLQLYTIKEAAEKDFLGTVRKVGDVGYDGVEFAGYFGTPAAELKKTLDDSNLRAAGTHHGVDILRNQLEEHIDYALAIGCEAILCPGFWGVDLTQESTFTSMADLFNHAGERCRASGLRFAYHIHGHEFVLFNGKTGMDILIQNTNPALVELELDTYWVERSGVDALQYFKMHGQRCTYLHLKDSKDRVNWHDAEVGDGVIDIAAIVKEAENFPVHWLIVEQEAFDRPPMESIAISLRNVRKLAAQG